MLPVPLHRRFGALVYDLLLNAALWMTVGGVFTALVLKGQILQPEHRWLLQVTLWPLMIGSSLWFYSYFWSKNQQTLGMQAWRLKIMTTQGRAPTFLQTARRLGFTLLTFGLGNLWCLFDRQQQSLQDRICGTALFYVPKSR